MALAEQPCDMVRRAVLYPELPHNRLHVDLYRRLRNVAHTPDHPIAMPFHETIEDLGLALRQRGMTSKCGHTLLI